MYEIAEWSDYGCWIIGEVKTEEEAKAKIKRLQGNSTFMTFGYRKK